jgi:phage-related protein
VAAGKSAGRVSIRVYPDTTRFREELQGQLDRLERDLKVKVRAELDTSRFDEQLRGIQRKANGQSVQLNATVNSKLAKAELTAVSRRRFADIVVRVNKASFVAASAAIARLSGGRVVGDQLKNLGTYLANLDRHVPKLAAVALAVTNLGAAALAGTSGALSLAGGLAQTAGAAVVLPGLLAGGAVAMVTLALALKDGKEQLKSLGPELTKFQQAISGKFWDAARKPILDLAGTLLPRLQAGMSRVSGQLGKFTGDFAGALSGSLTKNTLATMMGNLAVSIRNARAGIVPFVEAFTTLGKVGSSYLPKIGTALAGLATRFSGFISQADSDGSLRRWANEGISAIKTLGSVVGSAVGIIGGLIKAANAAGGGNGLTAFADNLKAISGIINGPAFQGALTTLFKGALAAMSGLGKAIGPIGKMIEALAPALANVMATAGTAVGGLLSSIAGALAQPAFAQGLTAFFDGIAAGLKAIGPALPVVAQALGALGTVAGALAANIGTILAAALQALAPPLITLLQAVTPLIPILGQALVGAVTALAPVLQQVATALAGGLTVAVQALAPLLPVLATAFAQILTAVVPIIGPMFQLVAALLTGLLPVLVAITPVLTQVATTFATVLTTAIAALLPYIPQLAAAWLQTAQAILPLVPLVLQFVQAILPLVPILVQAAAASSLFAAAIVGGLATAFVAVVQQILSFSAAVQAMVAQIPGALAGLVAGFTASFNAARAVVYQRDGDDPERRGDRYGARRIHRV